MKKFFLFTLTLCLSLATLVGCGKQQSQPSTSDTQPVDVEIVDDLGEIKAEKPYKFGFTIALRDQFLSAMETALVNTAKAMGVSVTTVDANQNANTQLQNVQTFASQKLDAIIVNLVSTDNASEILAAAQGIPVIFVNRPPADDLSGDYCYVGSNENNSGKFQGEWLSQFFKDKGKKQIKAVLFEGTLGLQHTLLRTSSVKKALADAGIEVDYIYEDTADFDRAKAQNKMQTFLGTQQSFDCVISNNDEMALGAIEAMKSAGLNLKDIPVVGIDATPSALTAMANGDMAFTVFQNPRGQGAGAVRAAVFAANGQKLPAVVDIPFEPVTIDNYKKYES